MEYPGGVIHTPEEGIFSIPGHIFNPAQMAK